MVSKFFGVEIFDKNRMFEKILITGGTGFIGKSLIAKLLPENYSLTVLTRTKKTNILSEEGKQSVEFIEIDLLNHAAVNRFVMDLRPQIVISLAGTLGRADASGRKCDELNFAATKNLLEISHKARARKIILFGTADEYGNQTIPQKESLPLKPQSEYAVSKAKMTKFALAMFEKEKVPVTILRPFTVYGAEQPPLMFMAEALNCAMQNTPFEMTEGTQKRDYIYIGDHLNAIKSAMTTSGIEGEVINVGSGRALELKVIAEKIWAIIGADKSLLKIGARSAGKTEVYDTCADISKAAKLLDWRPNIALEKGIKLTVEEINSKLRKSSPLKNRKASELKNI